ncbi:MAG: ATP-binding cassette domain-containing protein [Desulfobulbaceae bacterium]|nr:MAG: ATP-binding cassette domain-containing protein [Desulfobulbaceae bacterium]
MLLELKNVSKIFGSGCNNCLPETGEQADRAICPVCHSVVAVNDVSLKVKDKEILGVVGESGSGKSTLLQLIFQDQPVSEGTIFFNGIKDREGNNCNILELPPARKAWLRNHEMSMIYQNPHLGLNFNFSAGGNIAEKILGAGEKRYEVIRDQALYYFGKIEMPRSRIDDYPDNFSGGQQQRIQIAKALSSSPRLLLLDEPTTGLDVSVQARILDLIKALQYEMGFSMIVVSHDLGVINHLTDLTLVMKNGSLVEYGLTDQILEDPQHPYTQLLVSSKL